MRHTVYVSIDMKEAGIFFCGFLVSLIQELKIHSEGNSMTLEFERQLTRQTR